MEKNLMSTKMTTPVQQYYCVVVTAANGMGCAVLPVQQRRRGKNGVFSAPPKAKPLPVRFVSCRLDSDKSLVSASQVRWFRMFAAHVVYWRAGGHQIKESGGGMKMNVSDGKMNPR